MNLWPFSKPVPVEEAAPLWHYESHDYMGVDLDTNAHVYNVLYLRGTERKYVKYQFHAKTLDAKEEQKVLRYFKVEGMKLNG